MVIVAMTAKLGLGVEFLITLVAMILGNSRKVLAFHMQSNSVLQGACVPTNVALELSKVWSLTDLYNVIVQIKLFSHFLIDTLIPLFLVELLIARIVVDSLNMDLHVVHHLTGFRLPFNIYNSTIIVVLRGKPPLSTVQFSL